MYPSLTYSTHIYYSPPCTSTVGIQPPVEIRKITSKERKPLVRREGVEAGWHSQVDVPPKFDLGARKPIISDFLHFAQIKYNLSDRHAHTERAPHSKMNLVIVQEMIPYYFNKLSKSIIYKYAKASQAIEVDQ